MRLIDGDLLMKTVFNDVVLVDGEVKGVGLILAETVDKAHTIDAVPVVRCRECKHRYTENCPMYFHDFYWLEGYGEYVDDDTDHTEDDYFCPKGERKEGAERCQTICF